MAKNSSVASKILLLFDKILLKKYPDFNNTKQVTVSDVLNWDIWPTIVRIFGKCKSVCI